MKSYIDSEKIKIKHSFVNKLPVIGPIITLLLSAFLMRSYFQTNSYNWWYITILPGMLSLICSLYGDMEQKNKGSAILTLPLVLEKVWVAKVIVLLEKLALSCLIIFVGGEVGGFILKNSMMQFNSWTTPALACMVLVITTMWQIPLCLWLQSKIGLFLTVILNMGLNIVLGVTVALTDMWIFVPYAYASRLMCSLLKILPSGLKAEVGSVNFKPELISGQGTILASIISIVIFLILTVVTGKNFASKEAK
ncbi:MAG: lantibiotic immunity ABC transporter MutE/EpiE family permease subunit [Cellulosilyticaceae bacterium]